MVPNLANLTKVANVATNLANVANVATNFFFKKKIFSKNFSSPNFHLKTNGATKFHLLKPNGAGSLFHATLVKPNFSVFSISWQPVIRSIC